MGLDFDSGHGLTSDSRVARRGSAEDGNRAMLKNAPDINSAIGVLEQALQFIGDHRDAITLPQYRRLKTLRHKFADFLVAVVKADEAVAREPREPNDMEQRR